MKKFTLIALGCAEEEKKVWENTGFVIMDSQSAVDGGQCPDVVFWHRPDRDGTGWEVVEKTVPKLLVIAGCRGVVFPGKLSGIYEQQVIEGDGVCFTLGSKVEGRVKVPGGGIFRGLRTPAEQVRALAGPVYRYLLEDVMRENEEWCGHMSSVVGPM